jgi:hypothetical protein
MRHRGSFLMKAAFILLGGLAIMGLFIGFFAWAESTSPPPTLAAADTAYNTVGSFGLEGYPALKLTPTAQTPGFIKGPLHQKRGVILLVYIKGSADDDAMLASFREVKKLYGADASFFSFESHDVRKTGDLLSQLRATSPPLFAIIAPDGTVDELYTGWVDYRVMEQRVADAVGQ